MENKKENTQEVPFQERSERIISKLGNTIVEITVSSVICKVGKNNIGCC